MFLSDGEWESLIMRRLMKIEGLFTLKWATVFGAFICRRLYLLPSVAVCVAGDLPVLWGPKSFCTVTLWGLVVPGLHLNSLSFRGMSCFEVPQVEVMFKVGGCLQDMSVSQCNVPWSCRDMTVCVCVCVWVWVCVGVCVFVVPEKKADRRRATHSVKFPKTVGPLPAHSLTLNQPQSAAYF